MKQTKNINNFIVGSTDNQLSELENHYEFKKALNKLENELQKKEYELSSINKLYQDLKSLNEKTKKECTNLSNKVISLINEMSNKEKKYENEIESSKTSFNKQKEIYENKILKLSAFNPDNLKNKIENEIESKYQQNLSLKENEIEQLITEINELKKKNEILLTEYEEYKNDMISKTMTQKEIHKNEINNLIQKIQLNEDFNKQNSNSIVDKDLYIQLKNELENTRYQLNELNNRYDQLRHENEAMFIEKNELKINLLKITDEQKFSIKQKEADIERLNNIIEKIQNENAMINNNLEAKELQIKELLNEKFNLVNQLSNYELEFQDYMNEIKALRNLLRSHEEEINKNLIYSDKEQKAILFREKEDKENYQKQIDDLVLQFKEANTKKKNNDFFNKDSNNELIKILEQKDYEINKLKEELKLIRKDANKKKKYKMLCKMANENIEKMINKLSTEQKKDFLEIIQKNKNKYAEHDISLSANEK